MELILLIILAGSAVTAVFLHDLLKSALSLILASIVLAIIFFMKNAAYAGVFEISVVAGLIMVLFIAVISMTKHEGILLRESGFPLILFPVIFSLFAVAGIFVINRLMLQVNAGNTLQGTFGQFLWEKRTLDLAGQAAVILAGVIVVLSLFRKGKEDE